ncbi:MAG: sulfatase, partial [Candidatus Aminicenantes bacterium]|nr:sulfatase [Candidatus Aminicenantes bacterium]
MYRVFQSVLQHQKKILFLFIVPFLMIVCTERKAIDIGDSDCNVLLILIDALRPDHLPCYGYEKNTAPFISRLAEKGIVFENAISQSSWTKASVASLFTSLYPHNHTAKKWRDVLPLEVSTLAEELKAHGFVTYAVQTNTFIQARHNFDQGFDEYIESAYPECTADRVADLSIEFFKKIKERPEKFFAYLHFMDTHFPYDAPKTYREYFVDKDYVGDPDLSKVTLKDLRSGIMNLSERNKDHIRALYDAEIRFVDDQVQKIIDSLKLLKLGDNTIIIITSDHGEEFWEHGGFEHGHSMYNELLRVPLIIYNPKYKIHNRKIS